MYFSAASRITQATDTFFCFAISCSVAYNSGGKLAEARVARGLPVGFRPRLAVMIAPLINCSILQQCAASGKRGDPELTVMGIAQHTMVLSLAVHLRYRHHVCLTPPNYAKLLSLNYFPLPLITLACA